MDLRVQLVSWLGASFIRGYFKLCRIEVHGRELEQEILARRPGVLYAGWHRGFLYYAYHYRDRKGAGIISQSRDGELIASVVRRLGIKGFRGSSTRGGGAALRELVDYIRQGHIGGFTPDGPVGPPYVAKPGIIQLAARTGAPLMPFAWDAHPAYEFNSWDRTILPLPLSRIVVLYDRELLYVPQGLGEEEYEAYRQTFDRRLNALAYQARYYVKNGLSGSDPRDIPLPDDYLDYLPRRRPRRTAG